MKEEVKFRESIEKKIGNDMQILLSNFTEKKDEI